jgi:hypothetical protein
MLRHQHQGQANAMIAESAEARREALLQQLVRRFMLQGRVPSDEWAAREGTLFRFSQSLLNR